MKQFAILLFVFRVGGGAGIIILACCFVSKRADEAVNNDLPSGPRLPRC